VSAAKVDAQADYRRYGYLPAWVERGKENNVLQWLREASESGGFLVIVGDSSVGKTRLLYETVLDVLPDWFVLVPDLGEGDVVNAVADSTFRLPKLVVWLDELQRFLDVGRRRHVERIPLEDALKRVVSMTLSSL